MLIPDFHTTRFLTKRQPIKRAENGCLNTLRTNNTHNNFIIYYTTGTLPYNSSQRISSKATSDKEEVARRKANAHQSQDAK